MHLACLVPLVRLLEELDHRAPWVPLVNPAAPAVLVSPEELEHLDSLVQRENHAAAAHLASPDPKETVASLAHPARL